MKLALVQIKHRQTKRENLDNILSAIEKYGRECGLMLFPETCMGLKPAGGSLRELAEDIGSGEFVSAVRKACAAVSVHVCINVWEESGTDRVFNTALVIAPDGTTKAVYRKLHLFDALSVRESDDMKAGNELPPVFDVDGVKCSLAVCYDLRFPEVFRSAVFRGAELFLIPAAWYSGAHKTEHLRTLLAARALENTAYAACADICQGSFAGHSAVCSPFGLIEAEAGEDETVIFAEIDTAKVKETRKILPCLDNLSDIF
ncbi:carbon-nitrogen hydrolase family protein [Seleniivibrio woodruffii]|uniref:carbon-nitrogen hydrolase family protein n=1 Tax=Seleniivibrio woodruffii TaxID=1078050 RepID=UPI0039E35FA9